MSSKKTSVVDHSTRHNTYDPTDILLTTYNYLELDVMQPTTPVGDDINIDQ